MKIIEEKFTIKFGDGQYFHITARNYNRHKICFSGLDLICLSTDDMRIIANHLLQTATIIDADKDFNQEDK